MISWLGDVSGLGTDMTAKILYTLAIAAFLVLIKWIWTAIINRRSTDPRIRYRWRKALTYTLTAVGIVLIARVWLEAIQSLVTFLGLLSAGIAIALRDPIVNLFGWMFIGWRRPFTIGDRIEIGVTTGDVIDIGVSTFSLLEVGALGLGEQTTGRIVHVPNGKVFSEPLTNITQGFNYVWNEIPITVTFESDWKLAKTIVRDCLQDTAASVSDEASRFIRDASRKFLIHSANVDPAVYTRIVEHGVELSARYVCEARSRRASTQAVCEAILEAFSGQEKIELAYKTTRIFRQTEEGKSILDRSPVRNEEESK